VSAHISKNKRGALIDRGANGGILGNDAKVILTHQRTVDVTGIDNHELSQLKMVDGSAVIQTQKGPVIGIFRQYAYLGQHRSIHSSGQMEHFLSDVNDRSLKVTGKQRIKTNEGYVIPLDIINGLPYMKMRPNTDKEFEDLPHVFFTSGSDWNPKVLDNTLSDQEDWYNIIKELDDGLIQTPFDKYGNYKDVEPVSNLVDKSNDVTKEPADDASDAPTEPLSDDEGDDPIEINLREVFDTLENLNDRYVFDHEQEKSEEPTLETKKDPVEIKKKPIDYAKYRPYFLHVSDEKLSQTFKNTTQHAVNVMAGAKIQQTYKSPYPANNVRRRCEPVATDTIYAGCPAVDDGTSPARCATPRGTCRARCSSGRAW
jgi:hypothetical protein